MDDEGYFAKHRVRIEHVLSAAIDQVVGEKAPDPVLRLGQVLVDAALAATGTSQPKLALMIKSWRQSTASSQVYAPNAAEELNEKFASASDSFTFTYAGLDSFFKGLEGLVGSPSPDVLDAMGREHASTELFTAWNADYKRTTTPHDEFRFVLTGALDAPDMATRAQGHRHACFIADSRTVGPLTTFAQLEKAKQAGLLLAEVAGIRLYTGPMYVQYNKVLRSRMKGAYVTTLHAVNSGVIKLSRLTPASTVYRGVAGGVLPSQFWEPNQHGVMGGVELGFMSTTTTREVALGYMQGSDRTARMLFEIRMGMIDRGADVAFLSQFPAENEVLYAARGSHAQPHEPP